MKKCSETQALRAGSSKAEPNIFAPPQTPFVRAQDRQNLISWRWSLPSPTGPVWRRSMHAISSYRGNRRTNKPTNKHINTQTGPITIHCAAKLSAQCNEKKRSERRKHCALAVVRRSQKNSSGRRPLPGGVGRPKFNQLETVTTFAYKSSLVRIDARNFELSW